ncbi:MAG: tyrosine-type recombinase/integrase [Sandaracinaceae bacterium]|nr:tyrosine-type recombinase/integrase [Sandaracinaceae bacterium]
MSSIGGSTPFPSTGSDPAGYGGPVADRRSLASRKAGPATFAYANPPTRLRAAPHGACCRPRTIASYERTVRQFLDRLEERPSASNEVEAFLARPRRDGRPRGASTKRAELMALRAFFRFLARDGHGAVVDATHGIKVKRERRQAPPVAMPADVAPLFEAAARSGAPARNVAILGVLHVLGLRVHELAALDVEQVDLVANVLRRVRGKGGTVVDFPLPETLVAILSAWLRERAMLGHPLAAGPLFPTARPATSSTGRLSIRSLQRLVGKLARDAGLGRSLGPHALRHGCATSAIWLGVELPNTGHAMRHENLATTSEYVHLVKDARRDTYARIASLIPASVLPPSRETGSAPQNHEGNRQDGGAGTPLDFHPP